MFNEKVAPQGSQVRLHNYRKLGHQHSSGNTHGIHQETNTSGDERPRKQTMIYHAFSILLLLSCLCRFLLIINIKSKLTLFTVLINVSGLILRNLSVKQTTTIFRIFNLNVTASASQQLVVVFVDDIKKIFSDPHLQTS